MVEKFDRLPINEYFWDWLDEVEINEGDKIRVTTETHSWEKPFTVQKKPEKCIDRDIIMESDRGTEYRIVTFSSPHELEPACPMLRKWDGFVSMGVIEEVEIVE